MQVSFLTLTKNFLRTVNSNNSNTTAHICIHFPVASSLGEKSSKQSSLFRQLESIPCDSLRMLERIVCIIIRAALKHQKYETLIIFVTAEFESPLHDYDTMCAVQIPGLW